MNQKQTISVVGIRVRGVLLADEVDEYAGDMSEQNKALMRRVMVDGVRAATVAKEAGVSRQLLDQKLKTVQKRRWQVAVKEMDRGCPCDQCDKRGICYVEKIACQQFSEFIETGKFNPFVRDHDPAPIYYMRLFPNCETSKARRAAMRQRRSQAVA